jgi:AcrR family transcriptional regulator
LRKIVTNIKKPELVAKRRIQIINAAIHLFRKNGYHATTMREICKKARVNMGSFYDYFRSKEDILVYMYKEMMYGGKIFEGTFLGRKVAGWDDLEPFLKSIISESWNKNRNAIQLLYRETIALDKKTREEVMGIESAFVNWVAGKLRNGLGRSSVSRDLEVIANAIVFFSAFLPLRGWNMRYINQGKILNLIVKLLIAELREFRKGS